MMRNYGLNLTFLIEFVSINLDSFFMRKRRLWCVIHFHDHNLITVILYAAFLLTVMIKSEYNRFEMLVCGLYVKLENMSTHHTSWWLINRSIWKEDAKFIVFALSNKLLKINLHNYTYQSTDWIQTKSK